MVVRSFSRLMVALVALAAVFIWAPLAGAQGPSTPTRPVNHGPAPTIIYGPVSKPINMAPTVPTETINKPAQSGSATTSLSASPKATPGVTPDGTNENPECGFTAAFAFVIGNYDVDCLQGTGYYHTAIATLVYLVNNTGFRVWFHEDSTGGGWADCFDHGNAYHLGGRDENPGSIQITTNSTQCTPSSGTKQCAIDDEMAWETNFSTSACQHTGTTDADPPTPIYYLTNGSGGRVWLHQDRTGGGWADCFNNNNAYDLYGTGDDSPGNIQAISNSTPC
ncbi:MAG: hypothetical protein M0Z46_21690 [Actinomycetota bacterium]|jgi:hypothetical protein|nr:hypothetical protein [Actinomycetota bacterium]